MAVCSNLCLLRSVVDLIISGQKMVSTNGVAALVVVFFDRGTFWVLPLTYFHLPKRARAYLLPQSVKVPYFCSGPPSQRRRGSRKGTNTWVSTNWVTAFVYLFPQSVEIRYFCSGPISVDPILSATRENPLDRGS